MGCSSSSTDGTSGPSDQSTSYTIVIRLTLRRPRLPIGAGTAKLAGPGLGGLLELTEGDPGWCIAPAGCRHQEVIYQSGGRKLAADIRKLHAHFMLPRCARPE